MCYANISFWSDMSSFAGLLVGLAGLVITAVTLWQVNTVKRSVGTYRVRHLFAARSGAYVKQLTKIYKELVKIVEQPINVSIFLPLLAECKQICYSIEEKIDDFKLDSSSVHNWHLKSLQELESFLDETQKKITENVELDTNTSSVFLLHVTSLMSEIKLVEYDRKESI